MNFWVPCHSQKELKKPEVNRRVTPVGCFASQVVPVGCSTPDHFGFEVLNFVRWERAVRHFPQCQARQQTFCPVRVREVLEEFDDRFPLFVLWVPSLLWSPSPR